MSHPHLGVKCILRNIIATTELRIAKITYIK